MTIDPDLEHLSDHIELISATLEAYTTIVANPPAGEANPPSGPANVVAAMMERIATRVLSCSHMAALIARRRLGLSDPEAYCLWLLAAVASSPDVRGLLSRFSGESSFDPSLDTLRRVVYGRAPSRCPLSDLSPTGTLRRLGLIERSDAGGPDLHDSRQSFAISRRMLAVLHGELALDPAVQALAVTPRRSRRSPTHEEPASPALDQLALPDATISSARAALASERAIVLAAGLSGSGRRSLLRAAAGAAGIDFLEIDARKLERDPALLRRQLRAIVRECILLARAPLIVNVDVLSDGSERRLDIVGDELATHLDGRLLMTCGVERLVIAWDRPVVIVEVAAPSFAQRARLWRSALGQGTQGDVEHLATRYPLAPGLIHHAAEAAKARAGTHPLTPADIEAGIRTVLDHRLGRYARCVHTIQTWDDVVLAQEHLDGVNELEARVRERHKVFEQWGFAEKVSHALGVTALFSGPPGTGKTMIAALIANDLGLPLYQVDLSRVVSKWIGETETNLAAVFDAAEAGHAILLFDEADALFGKRTEVKSSNDRNANLETNYLLQRLDSFTGICLLTSNHESIIDPAFQRRLSLHLRFDLPDVEQRADLWRVMLPARAPVALDLDFMALGRRYAMSGGHVRNAALRAAFLAANEGSSITAAHLDRAARLEYQAIGKIA